MRRSLYVTLNSDGMKTLETDTTAFTTDGSFTIILENQGQPAHVHLHIDDALSSVATLEEPNWFVPAGDIEQVEVTVRDGASGGGQLEISTGYGAESQEIDVQIQGDEEAGAAESADSAESAGTTKASTVEVDTDREALSRMVLPGLFAAAGVLGAVALMVLVSPTAAVMLGALALLVAIAAAGYLLVQT